MVKIDNERYLRYVLLLGEGGTLVAYEILKKQVNTSQSTLEMQLKQQQSSLLRKLNDRKSIEKLFPKKGNIDTATWDISLFSLVVLTLFKHQLQPDEVTEIKKLRDMRNELSHTSTYTLTSDEFAQRKGRLCSTLMKLSKNLDRSIYNKCQDLIKQSVIDIIDSSAAMAKVEELRKKDEMITDGLNGIIEKVEELKVTVNQTYEDTQAVKTMMQEMHTRRTASLQKDGLFNLPQNWDDMDSNLKEVKLSRDSQEYRNLERNFCGKMAHFKVVEIIRVQNKELYLQYQARLKQMTARNPATTQNERLLWHGTGAENVASINNHGFNRSFCGRNATWYGYGVYFVADLSYAARDFLSRPDANRIKHVYFSRVLTGEFTEASREMRVPPQKQSGNQSYCLYDSAVDDLSNPSIFVVFHDAACYPDYVIKFRAI